MHWSHFRELRGSLASACAATREERLPIVASKSLQRRGSEDGAAVAIIAHWRRLSTLADATAGCDCGSSDIDRSSDSQTRLGRQLDHQRMDASGGHRIRQQQLPLIGPWRVGSDLTT